MNSLKLLVLTLIFSTFAFAQQEPLGLNHTDEDGLKQGAWVEYTGDGKIRTVTTYLDNSYHGLHIEFYNGRNMMRSQEYYKAGMQHGDQYYYDNGGRLIKHEVFVDGIRNGLYITYYSTKKKKEEHNYVDGYKHGLCTWFYENGDKMSEYTYERGIIVGTVRNFYQGDVLKSTVQFENGEMHGAYEEFYKEEGTIKAKGNYIKGKKTGKWTYYTADGKIEKTEKYKDGKKI